MTASAAEAAKDSAASQAKAAASDPNLLAKGLSAHQQMQEACAEDK